MYEVKEYLNLFEKNIVIAGVDSGVLKLGSQVMVPVKDGRLDNTEFGKFIGNSFDYAPVLVIDYYGLLKKSAGFKSKEESYQDVEVKRLKSNVIYFASIKIEDIVNLDKSLAVDFPGFKKYLVDLRGF